MLLFFFFLLIELTIEYAIPIDASDPHEVPTMGAHVVWWGPGGSTDINYMNRQLVRVRIDVRSKRIRVPRSFTPSYDSRMMVISFTDTEGGRMSTIVPRLFLSIHDDAEDYIVVGVQPGSVFYNMFRLFMIVPEDEGFIVRMGSSDKLESSCNSTLSRIDFDEDQYVGLSVGVGGRSEDSAFTRTIISTLQELDWIPTQAWAHLLDDLRLAGMHVFIEDQGPFYATSITRIEENCDLTLFPTLRYTFRQDDIPIVSISLHPEDYVTVSTDGSCVLRVMPENYDIAAIGWNMLRQVVTQFGEDHVAFCEPAG